MLDTARPPHKLHLSATIVAAKAMEIVDAEGYEALSFRTLGRALGCEAMSLYHYFSSKAHLRDALIDLVLFEAVPGEGTGSWRADVVAAAQAYRQAILRHPALASMVLCHLGQTENGLVWVDSFARLFEASGLPPEASAAHMRAVSHYLNGAVMAEACRTAHAKGLPECETVFLSGLGALLDWSESVASRHRVQAIREGRRARRRAKQPQ